MLNGEVRKDRFHEGLGFQKINPEGLETSSIGVFLFAFTIDSWLCVWNIFTVLSILNTDILHFFLFNVNLASQMPILISGITTDATQSHINSGTSSQPQSSATSSPVSPSSNLPLKKRLKTTSSSSTSSSSSLHPTVESPHPPTTSIPPGSSDAQSNRRCAAVSGQKASAIGTSMTLRHRQNNQRKRHRRKVEVHPDRDTAPALTVKPKDSAVDLQKPNAVVEKVGHFLLDGYFCKDREVVGSY